MPPVRNSLRFRSARSSSGRCDREQHDRCRPGTSSVATRRSRRRKRERVVSRAAAREVRLAPRRAASPSVGRRSKWMSSTANCDGGDRVDRRLVAAELLVRLLRHVPSTAVPWIGRGIGLGELRRPVTGFHGSSGYAANVGRRAVRLLAQSRPAATTPGGFEPARARGSSACRGPATRSRTARATTGSIIQPENATDSTQVAHPAAEHGGEQDVDAADEQDDAGDHARRRP